MQFIDRFIAWLNHAHDYHYDGHGDDKESAWYWHYEKCDCGRRREVMNDGSRCAYGGAK